MIALIILLVLCIIFYKKYQIALGTLLSGLTIAVFSFLSPLGHIQYFLLEIGGVFVLVGLVLYGLKLITQKV